MYYIYHIKDRKIGVSEDPEYRTRRQGFTEYEILELHFNIFMVSNREQELQKQYGYPVDRVPYWKTILTPTREGILKGARTWGRIGGRKAVESGHIHKIRTIEGSVKGGKIAGKKTSELKIGIHNPKKRKEYSQAGLDAINKKYTPEQQKHYRSKGAIKNRKLNQEQIDFVKQHYHCTKNQHELIPTDKMRGSTLAKMFSVNKSIITRAFKS